jgi:hypothetical protein
MRALSGLLDPDLAPAVGIHKFTGKNSAGTPWLPGCALQLQAGATSLPPLVGRELPGIDLLDVVVITARRTLGIIRQNLAWAIV